MAKAKMQRRFVTGKTYYIEGCLKKNGNSSLSAE